MKNYELLLMFSINQDEKVFDYFIQILILLSLIAFTIETLPNNSINTINVLNAFELICVIIFTIE